MYKNKYSISSNEWSNLDEKMNPRKIPLSQVKDKIEKVAFDIVKFKDTDVPELWRIESGDEGEYIIALYNEEDLEKTAGTKSPWFCIKESKTIKLFYKNAFVTELTSNDLSAAGMDLNSAHKYLPKSLANNKKLSDIILKRAGTNYKTLLEKYPELGNKE